MNYDHLNQIHDFWSEEIAPHLTHRFTVASFDDYLRKFSFLPSGQWLRDMEYVKLNRVTFLIDPTKFVKKYKDCCVTYNFPAKMEDGFQRVIYQLSPTLHIEGAFWLWIEQKIVQSYVSVFACYNVNIDGEYPKMVSTLHKMCREGNTEDKPMDAGFAAATSGMGFFQPAIVPPKKN